ncbi:MAG: metal-dependent hydrolase [Pseudomonadota bacterium]|nr:metal-dependent hydrolase [Pseudomonadota bacterium]
MEHRSVAHDLYYHLGGGYFGRTFWFFLVMLGVVLTWKRGTQVFIQQDRDGPKRYGFAAYLRTSRAGLLPRMGYIFRCSLAYFRWNYHPKNQGNTDDANAVLSELEPRLTPQRAVA